jgi:hypothetical protein
MGLNYSQLFISKIVVLFALLFLFSTSSKGQVDSTLRHQLGIDANKVLNFIFNAQIYAATLSYNYGLTPKTFLRTGASYSQTTGDEGQLKSLGKLGFYTVLKRYGKLEMYTGLDIVGGYEKNEGSQEVSYFGGTLPFIGIALLFGKHFSISTEPTFYGVFSANTDLDSYDQTVHKRYVFGFTNVGQVHLRFSF